MRIHHHPSPIKFNQKPNMTTKSNQAGERTQAIQSILIDHRAGETSFWLCDALEYALDSGKLVEISRETQADPDTKEPLTLVKVAAFAPAAPAADSFTPGPWKAECVPTLVGCCWKIGPISPAAGSRRDSNACVYVDHRNVGDRDEFSKLIAANARLIAAAPELLEALKALCEDWKVMPEMNGNIEGHFNEARAAIAKSEGAE